MKLYFFIICFVGLLPSSKGQKSPISFEQKSFDFFIDSLLEKEYDHLKVICYKPMVNNETSYLKVPIGFPDYSNKIDSLDFLTIETDQDRIKKLDLSKYDLSIGVMAKLIKLCPLRSSKKNKRKKSIQIEVFKRYTYRINKYVVEVKVLGYKTRTHYFIELDKNNLTVNQWYKVVYVF